MVKPRENRVPIMMSEEELTAIDDWRFQNRIATRSEAVRRLAQIAIRTSRHFGAVAARADQALEILVEFNSAAADALEASENRDQALIAIGELFLARIGDMTEAQLLARESTFDLAREIIALHDDDALTASLKRADESRSSADERRATTLDALRQAKAEVGR